MKRLLVIALFALGACTQMSSSQQAAKPQQSTVLSGGPSYALDGADCNGRANSRMAMYDRPDTYPISDQERKDAFQALYSACMREHNWAVAGPVHVPANTNYASLAGLSPAAGGNAPGKPTTITAGNTIVSSTSIPGATVLVIGGTGGTNAAQLSSLSPSSGGAFPQNATVVMLQPQQTSPYYGYTNYTPPSGPLPVAIPVAPPPMARGVMPAPTPKAQPTPSAKPLQSSTTAPQPPKAPKAPPAAASSSQNLVPLNLPKTPAPASAPDPAPQAAMTPPPAPKAPTLAAPTQKAPPAQAVSTSSGGTQLVSGILSTQESESALGWVRNKPANTASSSATAQNNEHQLENILDK